MICSRGQEIASADKVTCCQACWPEFNTQDLYGRRRPNSLKLFSDVYTCDVAQIYPTTHTQSKVKNLLTCNIKKWWSSNVTRSMTLLAPRSRLVLQSLIWFSSWWVGLKSSYTTFVYYWHVCYCTFKHILPCCQWLWFVSVIAGKDY